jgi:hypothetical protein
LKKEEKDLVLWDYSFLGKTRKERQVWCKQDVVEYLCKSLELGGSEKESSSMEIT